MVRRELTSSSLSHKKSMQTPGLSKDRRDEIAFGREEVPDGSQMHSLECE
jgi:hypothetical protein